MTMPADPPAPAPPSRPPSRPPPSPAVRSRPWSAQPLAGALAGSVPLSALLARVRESERRLALAAPAMPPGLAALIRAGPLDEQAWVLLVEHASAAAKLRQCVPAIDAALAARGIEGPAVKIKIRPRG
jgi:hypothetical protein